MGPPTETSPPLIFGQDFQPNPQVNQHNDSKSSINEDDDDDHTENLKSKQFDRPQIPGLGNKSAKILQSSSLPLILHPTAVLQRQDGFQSSSQPENNNDNVQIPFLKNKLSSQIQLDNIKSVEDSTTQSSFTNVIPSKFPTTQSSSFHSEPFEKTQISNDAASDYNAIPEGFENAHISEEASSSNDSQNDSKDIVETENGLVETAKEYLNSSLPQTKEFDSTPAKNIEDETLQSPSVSSKIENPPAPQYSYSASIYSNYEEREEKLFFDRVKFIAICGEDLLEHWQEPWPQDVKLYQPYEVEQVILPDNANCLAVQAYLKMCGLDFQIEQRHNAEYMSPSGRVPFIKCGAFVVSELDPIIAFINTKGVSLTGQLDAGQRADMRAYMSLANTVLANAELYVAWVDATTAKEVTRPRYGSVHPWPLNHIVTWQKSRQVRKRLAVLGWLQKSMQEVFVEVENCCNALSERLDKKDFFFGSRPTELDALVFGHLFTVLTTPLPSNRLASIVRGYPTLVELVKRVEGQFFQREN